MIGNVVINTSFGQLVGFENHSGQTYLEPEQEHLGEVITGFGNDPISKVEGAIVNNCFGTYLHGPVLPKNPHFADELIKRAVKRRFGITTLRPLDDSLEHRAHRVAASRPQ
jgi:CobQ-like glutamine amidotransferase family enzyme